MPWLKTKLAAPAAKLAVPARNVDAQLFKLVSRLPKGLRNWLQAEWKKRWVAFLLAVAVLVSMVPVAGVIEWKYALAAYVGAGVLVLLSQFSEYLKSFVIVVGAIVGPWLSVVSFNFVFHWPLRWLGLGLWTGLILAGIVFALVAYAYVRVWKEDAIPAGIVAVVLAGVNVLGVPLLLGSTKAPDKPPEAGSGDVVSRLDVAIIVPRGTPRELVRVDGAKTQAGWDVRWSVGRDGDAAVDWLLLDSTDPDAALTAARGSGAALTAKPTWRPKTDRVVVLAVDATPPVFSKPESLPSIAGSDGEITRWLKIAAEAAPGAQIAVLLQTKDQTRLDAWSAKVEARGGSVESLQDLGRTSLTDAAQVMAVRAPRAKQHLALAIQYRPVLLFDADEKQRSPLDVDDFFASGRVGLCQDDSLKREPCATISSAAQLESGPTHLAIGPPGESTRPVGSAIYVHPTEVTALKLLYLDYWWYLDGNPANIASGATCGVGLAIPGKTCFDHPSDWEGLVVVLDVSSKEARPLAVHFAQHKHVVRYSWSEAQARWATLRARPPAGLSHGERKHLNAIRENLAAIPDVAGRPLAFVGQGTHSTYSWPCTGACRQVVESVTENDHDGERSWSGNVTETCVRIASTCVRLFPTSQQGKRPALWNAFTGVWGHRDCILKGTYCTAELSPGAPSTQDRYKKPARITAWVDGAQRPHRCGGDDGPCPALPAAGKGP